MLFRSSGMNIRSDLILSNIRVLAIDAAYGPPPASDGAEAPQSGQGQVIIGSRATLELTDRDATLLNTAKKAGEIALTLRSIADMQAPQGATSVGRVYRDGVSQDAEGVRVYRSLGWRDDALVRSASTSVRNPLPSPLSEPCLFLRSMRDATRRWSQMDAAGRRLYLHPSGRSLK